MNDGAAGLVDPPKHVPLRRSEVGGVSPTGKSFRFVRACDAKLCVCLRDDVAPHRWVYFATKSSGRPAGRPCPCLPAGGSQLVSELIDVASPLINVKQC